MQRQDQEGEAFKPSCRRAVVLAQVLIRDAVTSFGGGDGADDMELIFACALCMLVVVVGKWESPRSARNRRRTRSPRCLLPLSSSNSRFCCFFFLHLIRP